MILLTFFLLQDLNGTKMLVPVGKAAERFRGVVQVNNTAAYILNCLKSETSPETICKALSKEYDGTEEQFKTAIETTISTLRECGALIE